MSAPVISFGDFAPKQAEYSLLLADLPGHSLETIGVLLLDPATDTLHVRLRRDWSTVASAEDAEVLAELEDDLISQVPRARRSGGSRFSRERRFAISTRHGSRGRDGPEFR